MSKKYAYLILCICSSLIVVNLGATNDSRVTIPSTEIKVSAHYLWFVLIFLLIPYFRELSSNNIHPIKLFSKQLNSELCSWSRKQKSIKQPDLCAPLIEVKKLKAFVWSCCYHQAGKNKEPSFLVISSRFNTLKLSVISAFKAFSRLHVLDLFTVQLFVLLAAVITAVVV